ncbi:Os07g0650000 [Oryza sativa Japonica Group]|uniref:Os07g0650000 protein n=2 Tax=Oryza sativa subsp. japonica TaxID=39947 RepID=Q0D427_ORYSJ|nr:hypothetical protein EE612_041059 [Oryza sativa]BAF22396.1 Os07g0650000 [Oryza sativa Japonica Group]BAT02954.1 Os07g0650000 [Oryza sativa Japonica Group]|eukprot:NP_001060482.1 Os07g0650000 [Oryza sativa Japonica Group]
MHKNRITGRKNDILRQQGLFTIEVMHRNCNLVIVTMITAVRSNAKYFLNAGNLSGWGIDVSRNRQGTNNRIAARGLHSDTALSCGSPNSLRITGHTSLATTNRDMVIPRVINGVTFTGPR